MKGIGLLLIYILISQSVGMLNPASVYCQSLGYESITKNGENGAQLSYCRLPNNNDVDAWQFLLGMVATEYNYCSQHGLETRIVNNSNTCIEFLTGSCAACILPNGTNVEVTHLMNLSFKETICGDARCGIGENFENCPKDCPSASWDFYCDKESDGKCDPDCHRGEDPDC
jgi:putative hemolysin